MSCWRSGRSEEQPALFCLLYKMQDEEATMMVLSVSTVMAVLVMIVAPHFLDTSLGTRPLHAPILIPGRVPVAE